MMTEKEIELKLEEYKGLLISTARRYKINGMDTDDIIQELSMQFVMALKDYDENKNANLKTLFITYATNWFKLKFRELSYKKRGIPLRIDGEEIEDGDRYTFIMSKEPTPEDVDYAERLEQDILDFLSKEEWGYIFLEMKMNGKKLREIAEVEGVTFQAIGKRYKIVKERLLKFLEERGYEIK